MQEDSSCHQSIYGGRLQGCTEQQRLRPRETRCHSLSKSMCLAIRLKFMIDIQPFRDVCSHARFVVLAARSSASSTVNSTLVAVSISIVSDIRWLLVLI